MSSARQRAAPVRFGTSGWRGILGDDFTFEGVRAVSRALADRLRRAGSPGPVVIGHDHRFLGAEIAETAARVLTAAGIPSIRPPGPVPTPVVAHAVRRRRAAAGLIVTASHNPPAYQGLKVVAPWGGAAPPDWTRDLERRCARILERGAPPEIDAPSRRLDLTGPYLRAVEARVSPAPIRGARPLVVVDAMHGVGAEPLERLLRRLGARVEMLNANPDPCFGGGAPDPAPDRLAELSRATRRARGPRLGVATDGDADRFAAVDASGTVLSETESVAVLVDFLARTGRARRGVAISWATGSLVEKVARAHGLGVERVPIGFKHLTAALRSGRADVAGEESGGFAWGALGTDKDGIVSAALLLELLATTGRSLRQNLRRLERRHGASACGRLAVPAATGSLETLQRLGRHLPRQVDARPVLEVRDDDGLHLTLPDGFLMLRASGTEPVLRVYAEAPNGAALRRRLRVGVRLLAPG